MTISQFRRLIVGALLVALIVIVFTTPDRSTVSIGLRVSSGSAPAQGEAHELEEYIVPTNPNARPDEVKPGPESSLAQAGVSAPDQPAAPGDMAIYRSVVLGGAEQNNSGWIVAEPSIGANGRTQFYTGNKFAALSTDYGQSWTHVNPFSFFPLPTGRTQFCGD